MEPLNIFAQSNYQARHLQLFQDIRENDLVAINKMIAGCRVMRVKADDAVITTHTSHNSLYILLDGNLEMQSHQHTDGSAANTSNYSAGECVGELSVMDNEARVDMITAISDSELLVIEADTLWQLIDLSNGVARNLLRLLSFRIRTTSALLRRRQKIGELYRETSMIDGLTGLHNRAWLSSQLPHLIAQSLNSKSPLSIIMADLDNFRLFK